MSLSPATHATLPSLLAQHGKVIVKFTAPWCGPCRAFAPVVEAAAVANPEIAFFEVDLDKEPLLARQWNVRSIPATLGFSQGQLAFQALGALSSSDLAKQIEKLK